MTANSPLESDSASSGRSSGARISRRALLGWGSAALVGSAVGAKVILDNGHGTVLHEARPAESLAAAFGVVTHFGFGNTVYAQTGRVLSALQELGVRNIRNRITLDTSSQDAFRVLANHGTLVEGVCGAFGDPQTMQQVLSTVAHTNPDPTAVFSAFEGINEPNNQGKPWIDETRSKTRDLFEARASFGLEAIPIVGPVLARVTQGGAQGGDTAGQSHQLGDLTPWIDRGNIHVYPRGGSPSTDLDAFINWQRAVCGNLPIYTTEGGYFTASHYVGGATSTPEDAVRQYVPRELMENWIRGINRFFLYELLDDPDATGSQREAHFGMLAVTGPGSTSAWTPKPHFEAMKHLLSIIGEPGAAGHAVSPLSCSIAGPGDGRTALVQKSDGTYYLCLWRDVEVTTSSHSSSAEAASETMTVTLDAAADVTIYAPSSGSQAIKQLTEPRLLTSRWPESSSSAS